MADDPGQAEGAASEGAQGLETSDAGPDTPVGEPITRRLRGRRNFRGHIVVDDEPLAVFDAPAEPPPAPPAAPDGPGIAGLAWLPLP